METTIVYRGPIGRMEKKIQTAKSGLGCRVSREMREPSRP